MDKFGYFAAWVGILGVLLAIPLTVLGNILTPKLVEWWSKSSAARRAHRVKVLKGEIHDLSQELPIAIQLNTLALGLWNLALAGVALTYLTVCSSIGAVSILMKMDDIHFGGFVDFWPHLTNKRLAAGMLIALLYAFFSLALLKLRRAIVQFRSISMRYRKTRLDMAIRELADLRG
jgi:hypothetical protein